MLSFLKTPYKGFYVDIGAAVGESDKIWTISQNTEFKDNIPLVMIHGFGAGVGLWILNLDALSANRPVYAMDTLGFGRSSRPTFGKDAMTCEKQFVNSIEEWRKALNISQMILLGHSMGGFLASSYALSHPERVKHLILADPWGFQEKPSDGMRSRKIPFWVRAIAYALTPFNPLWAIRAAGPYGESLVRRLRPDITRKFSMITSEEHSTLIPRYIHQCNAQKPSGESAFHTMVEGFGWAKNPMIKRLPEAHKDTTMTFIYGSESWMDSSSGKEILAVRTKNSVFIRTVPEAGHHVYADEAGVFNEFVNEACSVADLEADSSSITKANDEKNNNGERNS